MARPTRIIISQKALLHNLNRVKELAPGKQIIAMVKANAYGCGFKEVIPVLKDKVDCFGVSSLEEALAVRQLDSQTEVLLMQGVMSAKEVHLLPDNNFSCVIHQSCQLDWLLEKPLEKPLKVWVKVNTGMNRLGFMTHEVAGVLKALQDCPWVNPSIGIMSHFACADRTEHPQNLSQIETFKNLPLEGFSEQSLANSAMIFNFPAWLGNAVRPGIMLYGVSPLPDKSGQDLGLKPVMQLISAITSIHHYPAHSFVGYGSLWQSDQPSVVGIVPVGYGDGYPRHISSNTYVWVDHKKAPVIGLISMDMMAIDLTDIADAKRGDAVELWGENIPVEEVARSAGTIGYELICQVTDRAR